MPDVYSRDAGCLVRITKGANNNKPFGLVSACFWGRLHLFTGISLVENKIAKMQFQGYKALLCPVTNL